MGDIYGDKENVPRFPGGGPKKWNLEVRGPSCALCCGIPGRMNVGWIGIGLGEGGSVVWSVRRRASPKRAKR